jgi:hypothetical protein
MVELVDGWDHAYLGSLWCFISCSTTDDTFSADLVDLVECEILIMQVS